jgi:excisionase family DNA binding protein
MSIDDAVEYSGIGRTKVYALIKAGHLRPKKVGRRTLILTQELDAFVLSLPDMKSAA